MDGKLCFRLGKSCQVDLQTDCSDMTQNLTETCTRHFHAVTFHNASLSNQDVIWSCDIEGKRSNSVRVIVLDTDFTNNVTISGNEETGNDLSDPITLSCRSRCHAMYEFRWTVDSFAIVDRNISNTDYDSCNSVCRQNLTIYTGDVIQDIHVTCSVSDNSGRAGTDAYSIAGVVESSTVPDKWVSHRSISWYVWVGVAVGGVAIFAVVVATVAIVYKRRSLRSSSTALVMKNVLYESAEPCLQNATGNASKAEMEDNFLYERTGDMSTQDTNKIVMEDNILYEKTEDST
ncbi:uncharacterized protein [Haliotis cracherodii]|uniref:uncharacterized protein n=1 Tax=Haliotis cracherodii TaxID=6455 RepID=UPI0039ED74CD